MDVVRAVLDAEANKARSPSKFWNEDFRAYRQHGRLVFEDDGQLMDLPLPALIGEHQIMNAGTAIAIARQMQIPESAIEKGLSSVSWPARMQNLSSGALADIVTDSGGELWLDGGHNPHAARAVANVMADLEAKTPRPLILITGILANKDIGGFLDAYAGLASAVIGVTIPGHSALAPETLIEIAQARGLIGQVASNITDAVERAVKTGKALAGDTADDSKAAPRILICGSLYLAGEVLKINS